MFLPPGAYTVRFMLQGFATQEQSDVSVSLGKTVTLQVSMRSAFTEQVTVSGTAPVIDVRSTEMGTTVGSSVFTNLPVQRNFASVLLVAPGTNQDAVGVTVYGSSGAENGYYIDGVNTTGVERGTQGKVLNFEFIQEAQVKTGGYQAEYGRATGGLINVITKSGGNEFRGDVFGYYEGESVQDDLSSGTVDDAFLGGVSSLVSNHERADYGLDVGGFVVKDKLWFFGAYNYVKTDEDNQAFRDFTEFGGDNYGFPEPGSIWVGSTTRNLWSGKVTWRAGQNHSLIVSAFGDPTTFEGPVVISPTGLAAESSVFMRHGRLGRDRCHPQVRGRVGPEPGAQHPGCAAQGHQHDRRPGLNEIRFYDYIHPLYLDAGIVPSAGGYGPAQRSEFGRDVYRGDLAYFLANFGGDHELKFGLEYEHITIDNATYNSGGQRIYQFSGTGNDEPGLRLLPSPLLRERPRPGPEHSDAREHREPADREHEDRQPGGLPPGHLAGRLGPDVQPRGPVGVAEALQRPAAGRAGAQRQLGAAPGLHLGLPRPTARRKIYGSWGYFYESIPMDMVIRSFGNEFLVFSYNFNGYFSANPNDVSCDPEVIALGLRSRCTLTGGDTPVDPNLKGQYMEEYILGGEIEVAQDFVVGVKYINRNLGRVIEDMLHAGTDLPDRQPG